MNEKPRKRFTPSYDLAFLRYFLKRSYPWQLSSIKAIVCSLPPARTGLAAGVSGGILAIFDLLDRQSKHEAMFL